MIIDNFDIQRFAVVPDETDPVLIVDADAVLPLAVAAQRLERVAGCPGRLSRFPGREKTDIAGPASGVPATFTELLILQWGECQNVTLREMPRQLPAENVLYVFRRLLILPLDISLLVAPDLTVREKPRLRLVGRAEPEDSA
jgi:hypothetical protein